MQQKSCMRVHFDWKGVSMQQKSCMGAYPYSTHSIDATNELHVCTPLFTTIDQHDENVERVHTIIHPYQRKPIDNTRRIHRCSLRHFMSHKGTSMILLPM